jgi:predicted RNA-binding protein with PUA-like domain
LSGPFFNREHNAMNYWILKTEPTTYSYEDLERDGKTHWDGVRNFQARNNLKAMKVGDAVLIYHSVGPKELVGSATVVKEAYPDPSDDEDRWVMVDIKPNKRLGRGITLAELKEHPKLKDLSLVKQSRLSVCPVSSDDWKVILSLAS